MIDFQRRNEGKKSKKSEVVGVYSIDGPAGGAVAYSGLWQQVLQVQANSDEEQAQLAGRHPHTRFIDPDPGHCYQLSAD